MVEKMVRKKAEKWADKKVDFEKKEWLLILRLISTILS